MGVKTQGSTDDVLSCAGRPALIGACYRGLLERGRESGFDTCLTLLQTFKKI